MAQSVAVEVAGRGRTRARHRQVVEFLSFASPQPEIDFSVELILNLRIKNIAPRVNVRTFLCSET